MNPDPVPRRRTHPPQPPHHPRLLRPRPHPLRHRRRKRRTRQHRSRRTRQPPRRRHPPKRPHLPRLLARIHHRPHQRHHRRHPHHPHPPHRQPRRTRPLHRHMGTPPRRTTPRRRQQPRTRNQPPRTRPRSRRQRVGIQADPHPRPLPRTPVRRLRPRHRRARALRGRTVVRVPRRGQRPPTPEHHLRRDPAPRVAAPRVALPRPAHRDVPGDGVSGLVDAEVAAIILRVTPRRIRQLAADGTLTNHGQPRKLRLDIDQVCQLARARRRERLTTCTISPTVCQGC